MRAFPLVLATLLGGCSTLRPSPPPSPGPIPGEVVARYRVESGGRTLGYVTELAFPTPALRRYFRVEDEKFQDVGFITDRGLAYRFRPHAPEPIHVATDTMERNLRALFGTEEAVTLARIEPGR